MAWPWPTLHKQQESSLSTDYGDHHCSTQMSQQVQAWKMPLYLQSAGSDLRTEWHSPSWWCTECSHGDSALIGCCSSVGIKGSYHVAKYNYIALALRNGTNEDFHTIKIYSLNLQLTLSLRVVMQWSDWCLVMYNLISEWSSLQQGCMHANEKLTTMQPNV